MDLRKNCIKTKQLIEIHVDTWNSVLEKCEPLVRMIVSLSEQLACIKACPPCRLSDDFPYLKARLEQMVLNSIQDEVSSLQSLL